MKPQYFVTIPVRRGRWRESLNRGRMKHNIYEIVGYTDCTPTNLSQPMKRDSSPGTQLSTCLRPQDHC